MIGRPGSCLHAGVIRDTYLRGIIGGPVGKEMQRHPDRVVNNCGLSFI
jgi:hypothetical protein